MPYTSKTVSLVMRGRSSGWRNQHTIEGIPVWSGEIAGAQPMRDGDSEAFKTLVDHNSGEVCGHIHGTG